MISRSTGYSEKTWTAFANVTKPQWTKWKTRAAHKDGETDAVRTECTLWYLRNRVVACVMTKENKDQRWILDNEPQLTMANMGLAIINAFGGVPPTPASQ